jgi:hypothetical protein
MIDDGVGPVCLPLPEITAAEFEEFVAGELLGSASAEVNDLGITVQDRVAGADGVYNFDATVRYQFAGMAFLVVVEAKLHRNPIKREHVQVLHQKVQSVGAHKGVLVATSRFQSGAVEFATAHGIALVTVTESRFVFTARGRNAGLRARFVAAYHGGSTTRSLVLSADDEDHPACVATLLLGRDPR